MAAQAEDLAKIKDLFLKYCEQQKKVDSLIKMVQSCTDDDLLLSLVKTHGTWCTEAKYSRDMLFKELAKFLEIDSSELPEFDVIQPDGFTKLYGAMDAERKKNIQKNVRNILRLNFPDEPAE